MMQQQQPPPPMQNPNNQFPPSNQPNPFNNNNNSSNPADKPFPGNSYKPPTFGGNNFGPDSVPGGMPQTMQQQHDRQQQQRAEKTTPFASLSDFVAPVGGPADSVGVFAVTAGQGVAEMVEAYKADHDDYHAIMTQALADRLAEAFTEWLHQKMRAEWGIGDAAWNTQISGVWVRADGTAVELEGLTRVPWSAYLQRCWVSCSPLSWRPRLPISSCGRACSWASHSC